MRTRPLSFWLWLAFQLAVVGCCLYQAAIDPTLGDAPRQPGVRVVNMILPSIIVAATLTVVLNRLYELFRYRLPGHCHAKPV